jgi:hypothetical protein
MSRKTTDLTGLQTRKQLLVVESELNRVQLVAEWREMKVGIEHLAGQVMAVGSMAESAAKIGTSFAGFFRGFSTQKKNDDGKKPSWISTVFSGARAGISLWSALRSHLR